MLVPVFVSLQTDLFDILICNYEGQNSMKTVQMQGRRVEDTKGVIRIRISKRNRQHNGQKDKQRSTKHTHKTKDQVTRTPLKTGGKFSIEIKIQPYIGGQINIYISNVSYFYIIITRFSIKGLKTENDIVIYWYNNGISTVSIIGVISRVVKGGN